MGALRFDYGAVLVEQPLTAQTPQGELSLHGRVALSDAGKLVGTWKLDPKAIESLVGTQLDFEQPVPIELRIEGPLTQPRFAFANVEPVLEQVARAYGETQLEDAARKQLDQALEQNGGKQPESRGAKRQNGAKKQEQSPEDQIKREIQRRLGQ